MDYSKANIYKILNTITYDIYIGSTCQTLARRMAKHREGISTASKCHYKLYEKMKEIGRDCFYIELIEECPCDNKEQLRAIEGKYIREYGTLNHRIEGRSKSQYVVDTREQKKAYDIEYRLKNKEHRQPQKKEYYEANKEAIAARKKAYYERNKERLRQSHVCSVCG